MCIYLLKLLICFCSTLSTNSWGLSHVVCFDCTIIFKKQFLFDGTVDLFFDAIIIHVVNILLYLTKCN